MNTHRKLALKQLQSMPLEAKVQATKRRVREWYDYWQGDVCISFSGGKDSTVLKHIIDSVYDDVPSVFVNTGLEYPEIQKFVNDIKQGKHECFNSNIEILRPEMRFDEVIKKYGYPIISKEVSQVIDEARKGLITGKYAYRLKRINGEVLDKNGNKSRYNCEKWKFLMDSDFKISNKCCDVMKKKPLKLYERQTKRKPIIATMTEESFARQQAYLKTGCNAFESSRAISKPMSFWTEQDVLHYIKKYNVPYSSIYGDIVPKNIDEQIDGQITAFDILNNYDDTKLCTTRAERTGCIFCGFGCHLEKEPNRFQRLKETHPKQYNYCINGGEYVKGMWQPSKDGLGLGKVLDYIGVEYD